MNNDKSIYACYEEIKQREISELKEKLKNFGGAAHFGPDYTGEGATGNDMPFVCVHSDSGPYDVRIHAVSLDENDHLTILGSVLVEEDYPSEIKIDDIAYGNIEFITDSIPVRSFSQDSFSISQLSREDLEQQGFDTSNVDDKMMQHLADKLGDDYCEQLFWVSLDIIAESMGIPKK
ncbi:MAG: hypothetical protein IJV38_07925 [Prevotella sp.]|nr:hypothetical protein [Prevotella sp.]